jgi:hypothetical protein
MLRIAITVLCAVGLAVGIWHTNWITIVACSVGLVAGLVDLARTRIRWNCHGCGSAGSGTAWGAAKAVYAHRPARGRR